MEDSKDINVYSRISKGEYICNGDKLYTRDEMKKMLFDSGLSFEEVKMLYNLNAETVQEELKKKAGVRFMIIDPDEELTFTGYGLTWKKFRDLEENLTCLGTFLISLWLLVCFIFVFIIISYDLPRYWALMFVFITLVAAAIAFGSRGLAAYRLDKKASRDAEIPERYAREGMRITVRIRQVMMNSVCNTFHMYECMEDMIKDNSSQQTPE